MTIDLNVGLRGITFHSCRMSCMYAMFDSKVKVEMPCMSRACATTCSPCIGSVNVRPCGGLWSSVATWPWNRGVYWNICFL